MPHPASSDAAFARLEARMHRIEAQLSRLTGLLDQALPAVAMGVDVLDEEVARAQARGIDVDDRLHRAGALLEQLTDPAVLDSLAKALAHAELLGEGAELAGAAPGYAAMAIDVVDEEIAALQAEGVDIDLAQRNGLEFMRRLGRFFGSDQGQELLDSGLLEPDTIHRITQLSKAIVLTLNEEPDLIGPWGSFIRTWDKRFMRFAGFSFALAWRVGALLGPDGKKLPAPRS